MLHDEVDYLKSLANKSGSDNAIPNNKALHFNPSVPLMFISVI